MRYYVLGDLGSGGEDWSLALEISGVLGLKCAGRCIEETKAEFGEDDDSESLRDHEDDGAEGEDSADGADDDEGRASFHISDATAVD